MRHGSKIGVGLFVLIFAGAGLGIRAYFKARSQAVARAGMARGALMYSEELVWTLEGECLKDAERVLSEANAKKIATAPEGAEGGADRVETRLREYLRVRRDSRIWRAAERAFITMTPESRKATEEAAFKAGLRPVDILSEWMTCEGATDLYLMTKVHEDRAKLRASVGAVIDTFFAADAPVPSADKGVKVVTRTDDKIVVDLFGAKVMEECLPTEVEMLGEGKAKVRWKSNYNFLRDVVRGKKPEAEIEETLVKSDDGFGVEYQDWIGEFLAGADKQPWATTLVNKGVMALGEMLASKGD